MSADLYFIGILLSSFFATYPLNSLNGTQPKPVTRSEVTAIWKRMSEIWGIPSLTNQGPQNHLVWKTSQLNDNFNGLYLPNETWYSQLTTTRGLLHRLKTTWTLVHKRGQIGESFHPPSVKSAFHFIARLHRRRRRSANGTQPHFVKRWTI